MKAVQGLAVLALLALLPWPALAGTQDAAVVALDCPIIFIKGDPCVGPVPCSDLVVRQDADNGYYVFLLVARANPTAGVSKLSCGLLSENLLIDWTSCADDMITTGSWPENGTGIRISWNPSDNCQRMVLGNEGVHVLAGVFDVWAYGDASLEITPNTAEGETAIIITDCSGEASEITTPGGSIGFGSVEGYNPCLEDVPVAQRTWGRIKAHY